MNLSELQAFLEESGWDDEPFPAHPDDATQEDAKSKKRRANDYDFEIESIELSSEHTRRAEDSSPAIPQANIDQIPDIELDSLDASDKQTSVEETLEVKTQAAQENTQTPAMQAKPVKLVPKLTNIVHSPESSLHAATSVKERLAEIKMAQKMGYLLCKCTWPPQIMVLTGTDHVYRCRRCSRVREM